jgi:protein phosphatase
MLQSFAKTHIGQRQVNEDNYLIDKKFNLYIVADGVGGLDKGEVASSLACQEVLNSIKSGATLKDSVEYAHQKIINEIKHNKKSEGMATTIVAVLFNQNAYEIAWVGDSRVYIWDKGLKLITRDDSYVELLLENGHISLDELETHPDRNVISQALGIQRKDIIINYNSGILNRGQILMLCTDGLYSIANELSIIKTIKHTKNIEKITDSLVSMAVEKEGKDNITLLTIVDSPKSDDQGVIKKPHIYREFDISTGKVVGLEQPRDLNDKDSTRSNETLSNEVTDPELIDQTELKNLTKNELELLDTAASSHLFSQEEKNNAFFPVVLISILVMVGLVLFFTIK